MMPSLQIKLNRRSFVIWALALMTLVLAFMAFYPSMANDAMKELVNGKLNALPEAMLSVIGFDVFPDFTDLNIYHGYIMQYIGFGLAIYAITLGLNSYTKEEQDGTIEFLFAQPQTRLEMMIGKLKGNLILVTGIASVLLVSSVLSFVLFKPESSALAQVLSENVPVFLSYYVLGYIFLLVGMGLSMLMPSTTSVTGLAMSTVFLPYFIGIMAGMVESLKNFKDVSILHLLMPTHIIEGKTNLLSLVIWVLIVIAIFIFSIIQFQKRDIRV